jgi:hypothetical protein
MHLVMYGLFYINHSRTNRKRCEIPFLIYRQACLLYETRLWWLFAFRGRKNC